MNSESNLINRAALYKNSLIFSTNFELDNLTNIHFSKTGHSVLFEVPQDNVTNVSPPLLGFNSLLNPNDIKPLSTIIKQKTSFTLNRFRKYLFDSLKLRNTYSQYPYYSTEWLNISNDWFRVVKCYHLIYI